MEKLMQKRIQNCITARNNCEIDSWAYKFWDKTLKSLIEKGQENGASDTTKKPSK